MTPEEAIQHYQDLLKKAKTAAKKGDEATFHKVKNEILAFKKSREKTMENFKRQNRSSKGFNQ